MAIAGEQVWGLSYAQRLNRVYHNFGALSSDALKQPPVDDATCEAIVQDEKRIVARNNDRCLTLCPKRCVPINHIKDLWGGRTAEPFRQDGIVFTPDNEPMGLNTQYSMYKWKEVHTIDVLVENCSKRSRDGEEPGHRWSVYVGVKGDNVLISDAVRPVVSVNCAGRARQLFSCDIVETPVIESIGPMGRAVVECTVDVLIEERRLALFPVKHRLDKNRPNQLHTFESTISNITENLRINELINILDGSMDVIV